MQKKKKSFHLAIQWPAYLLIVWITLLFIASFNAITTQEKAFTLLIVILLLPPLIVVAIVGIGVRFLGWKIRTNVEMKDTNTP